LFFDETIAVESTKLKLRGEKRLMDGTLHSIVYATATIKKAEVVT
jgi:hypothetical protein